MAKRENEVSQPGIIGRTIRALKLAVKVVVGGFLALMLLVAWIASRNPANPVQGPAQSTVASAPIRPSAPVMPGGSSVPKAQTPTPPIMAATASEPTPTDVPESVTLLRPGGAGHAHVCTDRPAYDELQKLLSDMEQGKPNIGRFTQLGDEGRVLRILNGTHAVALRSKNGARFVRLTEGYKQGESGWVDAQYVRPIPAAEVALKPRPTPRASTPPPVDPEKRAETIFNMGKNLEQNGILGPALENYQRVVTEFPGTKAATEAAKKVKVLGK